MGWRKIIALAPLSRTSASSLKGLILEPSRHFAEGPVEFHLAHGDWIRLLRSSGFEIEDLLEVQVPKDATTSYPWMSAEWAHRWPCEEVWKTRKSR